MVPLPTSSSPGSGHRCRQDNAVAGRSLEEKPRPDSMLHLGSQGAKDPVKSSKTVFSYRKGSPLLLPALPAVRSLGRGKGC